MNYYIKELNIDSKHNKTAGNKARIDVHSILDELGFQSIDSYPLAGKKHHNRLLKHIQIANYWNSKLLMLKNGDTLLLQIPIFYHSLFLNTILSKLKRKGVKLIAFIHDLESVRYSQFSNSFISKFRVNYEEKSVLRIADAIISHNSKMSDYLRRIIPRANIVELEMFDYYAMYNPRNNPDNAIIVAGNLSKQKSGYIYSLPDGIEINLYGVNYEGIDSNLINYKGSYYPDVLINKIKGKYGLVWDGDSLETCSGVTGEYLKINSPHKMSLYLASELPIIIWKDAAMASFVKRNKCGVLIDNLQMLHSVLHNTEDVLYNEYKNNSIRIGKRIKEGYFTKKAVKKVITNLSQSS